MARTRNPWAYPDSYRKLTLAATVQEVWIPCPNWGKALNLRQTIYAFWRALREEPIPELGDGGNTLMATLKERDGVHGVLVSPRDKDPRGMLIAEALASLPDAEPPTPPAFLEDFFQTKD